jgi:hypothetical protein
MMDTFAEKVQGGEVITCSEAWIAMSRAPRFFALYLTMHVGNHADVHDPRLEPTASFLKEARHY